MDARLHVVMYHYVRDVSNSEFPKINGLLPEELSSQIKTFQGNFEMATLETAMEFLTGNYHPKRDLCLLTFDDGLREHHSVVTPILVDHGVKGIFFVITGSTMASVHMNHHLMASLDFPFYREIVFEKLPAETQRDVDETLARKQYPFDSLEVAQFKFLFNFMLPMQTRDEIIRKVFQENLGDPETFSQSFYLSWDEAKEMQEHGMVLGGHSHQHKPLEKLEETELRWDLENCKNQLIENVKPQPIWPFCFPYGGAYAYGARSIAQLQSLGFQCSFTTEVGTNNVGDDPFTLRRFDCKNVLHELKI